VRPTRKSARADASSHYANHVKTPRSLTSDCHIQYIRYVVLLHCRHLCRGRGDGAARRPLFSGFSFMTDSRAPTSVVTLVACLMLCALLMRGAQAQDAESVRSQSARTMHFELPAQPLALTLQAFGRMTEMVLLAPAPLLEGRTSAAVSGDFAPHDALTRVLEGTGLQADFSGPDEAMIVTQSAPAAPDVTASGSVQTQPLPIALPVDGLGEDGEQRAYAAMIQERLTDALCAQDTTRPGNYRLVAQMRIDDKGTVSATELIASSGSPRRDAAIEAALRTLKFDAAPPPGLPEPVTILLRPSGNGVHINCPPAEKRG
jgi:hypothetical protein